MINNSILLRFSGLFSVFEKEPWGQIQSQYQASPIYYIQWVIWVVLGPLGRFSIRPKISAHCSVPNKLVYSGNFFLEHEHVATRLLGRTEYG